MHKLLEFALLLGLGLEQREDSIQNRHVGIIALEEEIVGVAVGVGMHQQRAAGLAIAPGPPDFLVVTLNASRQCGVDDGADVGLVNPHAESDRGHDDFQLARQEILLHLLAALGVEPRVIGGSGVVGAKLLGYRFRLLARRRIDNRRAAAGVGQQPLRSG